jgi:acetyl-CoA acetyltransferase
MANSLRGAAAAVGIGLSDFGIVPDHTHYDHMAQALHRALADAGLKKSDIDGVFCVSSPGDIPIILACEYLGLKPLVMEGTMTGGSSFVHFMQWAALALEAGLCENALILYGSDLRSGAGRLRLPDHPWEAVYKPRNPPVAYALAAARHMHEYGTTREQLAEVAVAARGWAQKNPAALMRDPLSIDEVLGARMLVDPLSILDCCLVTDGGGAVIMTKSDRAKDFPNPPAYLLGVAAEHSHASIAQMDDLTTTAAARSGARAFEMAGIKPSEVDVLELYDAFTINTIMFLEDLGYCAKGEGGAFVENGAIAPGGKLPVNTNGGGLSCVHPGMYGIFLIIEAIEQLRGQAGERQIGGAEIALVQGNGGTFSSEVTALLGVEAAL